MRYPSKLLWVLLIAVMFAFIGSGIQPFDRGTWWMEVAPVIVVVPLLCLTWRRFELTTLLYVLIALHAMVLILGGAYSYARVPLGFWIQDLFMMSRNPYDKIGHFMQGFVPVLAAREVFIRRSWVNSTVIAGFVAVCFAMTVSAVYELIEWVAALMLGQGADEFLGTQGDVWDTQSDMLMALLGSILAILLLSRWQDQQIKELP